MPCGGPPPPTRGVGATPATPWSPATPPGRESRPHRPPASAATRPAARPRPRQTIRACGTRSPSGADAGPGRSRVWPCPWDDAAAVFVTAWVLAPATWFYDKAPGGARLPEIAILPKRFAHSPRIHGQLAHGSHRERWILARDRGRTGRPYAP